MIVMGTREPSRRAAEAETGPDSSITPLGKRKVGRDGDSLTVTLPKQTAEGEDIEVGDELQVGYDAVNEQFVYRKAEAFDG